MKRHSLSPSLGHSGVGSILKPAVQFEILKCCLSVITVIRVAGVVKRLRAAFLTFVGRRSRMTGLTKAKFALSTHWRHPGATRDHPPYHLSPSATKRAEAERRCRFFLTRAANMLHGSARPQQQSACRQLHSLHSTTRVIPLPAQTLHNPAKREPLLRDQSVAIRTSSAIRHRNLVSDAGRLDSGVP